MRIWKLFFVLILWGSVALAGDFQRSFRTVKQQCRVQEIKKTKTYKRIAFRCLSEAKKFFIRTNMDIGKLKESMDVQVLVDLLDRKLELEHEAVQVFVLPKRGGGESGLLLQNMMEYQRYRSKSSLLKLHNKASDYLVL